MSSDTSKPNSLYANNFGATERNRVHSQENTVNIESVIVDLLLKPLVNRLIDMQDEIMNQENLVFLTKLSLNSRIKNGKFFLLCTLYRASRKMKNAQWGFNLKILKHIFKATLFLF
jgi:hypothetical protein